MMKTKLELKDIYIIICVGIAIIIMALCYLHFTIVNGKVTFLPRIPGKEWWAVTSMLVMRLFMAKLVPQDKARTIQHACGITVFTLFLLAGVLEYFDINPGTQFWTLVGSVLGVWVGVGQGGAS